MTECPSCHQQIEITEANHGTLFTCPRCSSVYFVGWDGQPEQQSPETYETPVEGSFPAEAPTEMAFVPIESNSHETIIDNSSYQNSDYDSLEALEEAAVQENLGAPASNYDFAASPDFQTAEMGAGAEPEVPVAEPVPEPEANYDFNQPLGAMDPPSEEMAAGEHLQEIANFANADIQEGALTYTVRVEGIDSAQIRSSIAEAITDSRFGWDVQEVLEKIENGVLELKGINPAKAYVLLGRLKYLAVQISWRQDVFSSR